MGLQLNAKEKQRIIIGSGDQEVVVSVVGQKKLPNGDDTYQIFIDCAHNIPVDREALRHRVMERIDGVMDGSGIKRTED
jgi:hypothetical protein